MANSYFHIFTDVYLWTYIYYVPTTYLLYICYIKMHSFHLCSFCCFSEMLFIIKILTIDMLGIYHGYSDMAWWMSFLPLWWGILFMWSKYHFVQYIYFCIPSKHFFNIYFVGTANHITCIFASEFSMNFLCIDAYDHSLPGCLSHEEFINKSADFFINKTEIIRSRFQQSNLYTPPSQNCANLTQFRPICDEKTLKILNNMKKTTCDVYLCKINFFMAFPGVLLRTWTKMVKKSPLNGSFLQSWKKAVIRLLMKSCKLYRDLKNYQSISNLLFISKWIAKLSSFKSPHSLKIKTYCLPTRIPSTNTIQQKQWY